MQLKNYQQYLEQIADNNLAMQEQLWDWASINSGSYNLTGLALMRDVLQKSFAPLATESTVVAVKPIEEMTMSGELVTHHVGDVLHFIQRPKAPIQVLLTGHMDTVYPISHPFQALKKLDEQRWNGPGVTDMKGGLVVMLQTLSCLEKTHFANQIGWEVIINADEELGSLSSASFLESRAVNKNFALIFEPAMTPEGAIASERKGSGKWTIIMFGKAAHAGRAFNRGRNAICALAELIVEINQLNAQYPGLTINVGKVLGGTALNIVPDQAMCQIDVRIEDIDSEKWLIDKLRPLIKKYDQREGYSVLLHGGFTRRPKQVNAKLQRLFEALIIAAKQLNQPIEFKPSGGCCDGNNLAHMGLPVIDSLGVCGGNIHSENEYILLNSLVERTSLASLLLMGIAQGELQQYVSV